jgi:hypothetical protein
VWVLGNSRRESFAVPWEKNEELPPSTWVEQVQARAAVESIRETSWVVAADDGLVGSGFVLDLEWGEEDEHCRDKAAANESVAEEEDSIEVDLVVAEIVARSWTFRRPWQFSGLYPGTHLRRHLLPTSNQELDSAP